MNFLMKFNALQKVLAVKLSWIAIIFLQFYAFIYLLEDMLPVVGQD